MFDSATGRLDHLSISLFNHWVDASVETGSEGWLPVRHPERMAVGEGIRPLQTNTPGLAAGQGMRVLNLGDHSCCW